LSEASRFVKAKSKPLACISENRQLWKVWKVGAFLPLTDANADDSQNRKISSIQKYSQPSSA